MAVKTQIFELETRHDGEIIDITKNVQQALTSSGLKNGILLVFVPGATGAITTIEYEPGLLHDFPDALDRLIPKDIAYEHHLRWQDGNGHSHVRASFLGPGLNVPFSESKLMLGTWQQIVFLELDNKGRHREIIVQLIGE